MNSVTYISVKAAVNEYLKTVNPDDEIDRTRIMSAANVAASMLTNANIKDISVVPLQVYDYKAQLPANFYEIIQVLYRKEIDTYCKRIEVVEWTKNCFGTGCDLIIKKECPKCHMETACDCGIPPIIIQADHHWNNLHSGQLFTNTLSYKGDYVIGENSCSPKFKEFNILNRTTNNFHSLKYDTNDNCDYRGYATRDEYDIKEGKIITSSDFKKGELLLAYLSHKIDEDGYYMIIDNPIVIKAVTSYIMSNEALASYAKNRTQNDRAYWSDMNQLSQYDMDKALKLISMPSFDIVKASIKNHWSKVVTNYHHQYNLGRYRPDEYNPER